MKIVGVTSCITGIAHTYMAAESLEQAGKKLGHEVKIETQGSAGINPIKQELIDAADAVIFAVDLEVNGRERFNGKPFVQVGVAKAMGPGATNVINSLLEAIENGTAQVVGAAAPAAEKKAPAEKSAAEKKGGLFGGLFGKK